MQNDLKFFILILILFVNSYAKDSEVIVSASVVGMSMDYREYDNSGTILDSEQSNMNELGGFELGIGVLLNQEIDSYDTFSFKLMVLNGETIYKGSYIGGGLPVVDTTQNYIVDTGITYRRSTAMGDNLDFIFGIGLGYYAWERSLSSVQVELYEWYTLRPMIGTRVEITEQLDISFLLEYRYGFNATMSSSYPNLDFTLGSVDLFELSIPIKYKYSEDFSFIGEFVYQKQTIAQSNVNSGYYEPDSTAKNQYLKIGVAFKF